jgi:hypothetical protein
MINMNKILVMTAEKIWSHCSLTSSYANIIDFD